MNTPWSDAVSMEYHLKQWIEPKQSTIAFARFIKDQMESSKQVIDVGCGAGGATNLVSKKFPNCNMLGIDNDEFLIKVAIGQLEAEGTSRKLAFQKEDAYKLLKRENGIDGVISLQTISWLSSWQNAMEQIYLHLQPKWIAISSLFYSGEISANIEIREHLRGRITNYNVISIEEFNRHAKRFGYQINRVEEFEIDIDIPKPKSTNVMGTYTRKIVDSQKYARLQISGPILMPWYFINLERYH